MIYVDRNKVAFPNDLLGPTSTGAKELEKVVAFYRVSRNRTKAFKNYRAYKLKSVTAALEALFNGKCAYCESNYSKVQPVDVEHFRPKGGVAIPIPNSIKVKLVTPGYYWLAAEWSNLYPSCIDCNRERTHEFEGEQSRLTGKANKFPIQDETLRAKRPGQENRERVLLLCPCIDDPHLHLFFEDNGNVRHRPRSRKGKVSIDIFGLRRPALVHARQERAIDILATIRRLRRLEARKILSPMDRNIDQEIIEEVELLKRYAKSTSEYSGMARQLIARHYRTPL